MRCTLTNPFSQIFTGDAIDRVIIHKKRKRRISENSTSLVADQKRPQSDPPIMTESPAKISVISTKRAASTESAESAMAKNLAQKRRKRKFVLEIIDFISMTSGRTKTCNKQFTLVNRDLLSY